MAKSGAGFLSPDANTQRRCRWYVPGGERASSLSSCHTVVLAAHARCAKSVMVVYAVTRGDLTHDAQRSFTHASEEWRQPACQSVLLKALGRLMCIVMIKRE